MVCGPPGPDVLALRLYLEPEMVPKLVKKSARSFAEVSFLEAVGRRVQVTLVLKPVPPGRQGRLVSRFLGWQGADGLVLEVPRANGAQVFVPIGWELGISFAVGRHFLQAMTTVREHCQFPLPPGARQDAVVVACPRKVLASNRRAECRKSFGPNDFVYASMWSMAPLDSGQSMQERGGRALNESASGLGIRTETPLPDPPGTEMLIRLERRGDSESRIVRGVLKHCSLDSEGFWLAGFGDVQELAPGDAVALTEAITARRP
jgi:hypothetical protein